MTEKKATAVVKAQEPIIVHGKYVGATGRRKTAVARIRVYEKGTGEIIVNGQKASQYFSLSERNTINQPIKLVGMKDIDVTVMVSGGGKVGQSEAIVNGLANVFIKINPELRPTLRAKEYLTRDARKKERKKPGLKKARKAPQWAKR